MSSLIYNITDEFLSLEKIAQILHQQIALSEEVEKTIIKCRAYLDQKTKNSHSPLYGINTGFGSLYKKSIPQEDLEKLQINLVKSHACGLGKEVPQDIVKMMLLLKILALAKGYSGVALSTVQRLIDFYNHEVYPVVYEIGSLGASGDLAPLAHLSLPLAGLGEVYYQGKKYASQEINKKFGWEPLRFQSKEGLALLNGTQFMAAYGMNILLRAHKLAKLVNIIASISLEGYDGRIDAFDELIHKIRPHQGQLAVAKTMRTLLEGSEIINQEKKHVQDPYSFRCIPQVHGASQDTLNYVTQIFLTEINAVTDNPNIFPDEDKILSGGNFHGQPLALGLDFLCIALAELGSISERRTYLLISGQRGLPEFLVANAGLNSGLMIPQYTAAALVSQNKQLCTPSSIDSIPSSNGQEDHVSMGANGALKAYQVLENVENILAIELLNGSQALHFRRPLKTSTYLETFLSDFRKEVAYIENDKILRDEIIKSLRFIRETKI